MADNDLFQKYLDAGIAFTNLTRARVEELVSDLVKSGEFSAEARAKVEELIDRSHKSQEALFAQVRQEVDHQLARLGITNLDDLAEQVAALIGRTAEVGRKAAAKKSSAKKAGKKAAAKRSATRKSPAKKAGTKKAAAKKKAATKKSPAKKSSAKSSATKKSPAKKSAAAGRPRSRTAG